MAVVGTTAPRVACAPLRVQQRQQQRRRGSMRVAAVASPVKPAPSGKPASGKAAAISKEEAAMLYHDMVLGREFEEMCAQMYYRGKMFGFVHLYSGQEAVSTGAPPPAPPHRFAACCSLQQQQGHMDTRWQALGCPCQRLGKPSPQSGGCPRVSGGRAGASLYVASGGGRRRCGGSCPSSAGGQSCGAGTAAVWRRQLHPAAVTSTHPASQRPACRRHQPPPSSPSPPPPLP